MSKRSEQSQGSGLTNPATKFIEFHGKNGKFTYYNKESKTNVDIKPMFMILKEFSTITGFNRTNGGMFSNEIEDISTEELDVRYYKGDNKNICKGLWSEIKDKVGSKSVNGKFTKSVYISSFEGGQWSLQNIKLSGMQFSKWLDMIKDMQIKGVNKFNAVIQVDEYVFVQNGDSPYYYPTFKFKALDETDASQKAMMLKADAFYDIVEDFVEKRKLGIKGDAKSARESQSTATANPNPTPQAPAPQSAPVESPFASEAEAEDEDDFPF